MNTGRNCKDLLVVLLSPDLSRNDLSACQLLHPMMKREQNFSSYSCDDVPEVKQQALVTEFLVHQTISYAEQ